MAIDVSKFIGRFIDEAREHLSRLDEGLRELGSNSDPETINTLFRSAHTIKGSSRMLRLRSITDTAHQLEEVLGSLRESKLAATPALIQLMQRAVDELSRLSEHLASNSAVDQLPPTDEALCAALAAAANGDRETPAAPTASPGSVAPSPATTQQPTDDSSSAGTSLPPAGDRTPTPAPASSAPAPASPSADAGATANTVADNKPAVQLRTAETVRIRLSKLDELIKLMTEVVATQAHLRQREQELGELQHRLAAVLDEAGQKALGEFALTFKDNSQHQAGLMRELHDRLLSMRMLPLNIVWEPAARLVRELAHSVGKQVECVVSGGEIELDRQLIDRLSDPVIHLIRNAIDHGLEDTADRIAAGKPAHGRLLLSARQDAGWVLIEISDDGAGIPLQLVREKAVRKGLLDADKAASLSDQETIELIFLPGFSTTAIITDLSGRGVGMDVVRRTVLDELLGTLSVDTRAGAGTRFSIRLPLSLAMMRVLIIRAHDYHFAFTAQYIAELLQIETSSLLQIGGRDVVIIRNEFVPVLRLDELLGLPAPATPRTGSASTLQLVVLQTGGEKISIVADTLVDEHDMVIKTLPAHLRRLALISGMVITGSNEPVSVLHPPGLIERARQLRQRSPDSEQGTILPVLQHHVLVVDDSLNTREIEKDVLQAYGYHVTLAEDGADGLRKALAHDFDAILTDVEMPHMDGFSLTAELRQQEKYRDTPIIIITSREKEADKRRGMQVGADAYIVKGDFDQSNLIDTLRTLLG